MVNFLKIFEKFFCTDCVGHSNCVSVFALTGRLLSLHRLSGAHELPQAVRPIRAAVFSLDLSEGIRRLRTAGTLRHPPRGQKG